MEKNGNGSKTRLNIQTILLVITIGFLLVDKIILPAVSSGPLANDVKSQALAITRLEQCVKPLESVPDRLARIEVKVDTLLSERGKK